MPRKWFVYLLLALAPVFALLPSGCVPPGDVGVALLVNPGTLNFGTTATQKSFQVSKIISSAKLQPVVATASDPWIIVEDCTSPGDQCLSIGPIQDVNVRVSVRRDQMVFGTNRGKVILTSSGASVKTVDIVAEDTIQAAFSADRRQPEAGQPVQFTDLSLADADITARLWNFGDGATSTAINPAHIYEKDGVYSVSLTVTTANLQETTTLDSYITVATTAANVDFAADRTTIAVDEVVFFTNLTVSPSEPVLSYAWDFGDGGLSTEPNPNHQYRTAGPKTVTLTITTAQGTLTKTKTNYILVQSKLAPTAKIAVSQTKPYVDIAVRFDDVSDAGASPIINRVWEFGDGLASTDPSPQHVYRIVGAYTVKLTVITEHGSSQATMPIEVVFKPPTANFEVSLGTNAPADTSATNPDTFQDLYFVDLSEAGSGPVTEWLWKFGDGKTSTDKNPVHHYTAAGTYTVSLTARTPMPSNNEDTLVRQDYIVVVAPPQPDFRFSPRAAYIGVPVQFTNATSKGSETITGYKWDFDGLSTTPGDASTAQNPTYTFNTPGKFGTTLTVTTATRTRKVAQNVIVDKAPAADFNASPRSATTVDAIQFTDATKAGVDGASVTSLEAKDDSVTEDKAIVSRQWLFGDGGTSTQQNPTHTYTTAGTYDVTLIVTYAHSGTGQTFQTSKERAGFITIKNPNPPVASFNLGSSCLFTGNTVAFTDTSTNGTKPITSWLWKFGDGTPNSTQRNPTHVYTRAGEYTVTLTVTSSGLPAGFNSATTTQQIFITNVQDLDNFVNTPDPAYQYSQIEAFPVMYGSTQIATAYNLYMVSQTWRSAAEIYTGNYDGRVWNHNVTIIQPANLTTNTGMLLVNGGSRDDGPLDEDFIAGSGLGQIAALTGATMTIVTDVPAQPIEFMDEVVGDTTNERTEDEIISYSFKKYFETFNAGVPDKTWPALFPMTKAVVRTMDTVQDFMEDHGVQVDDFIVAGGSKRGWTTWLTGITDCRVKAIAPIVADLLNTSVTVPRDIPVYGAFPPTLGPYVTDGVFQHFVPGANGQPPADGASLLSLVDPYSYRQRIRIPKLLINSTGDQFFLPDSSQFYVGDLKGETRLTYLPNTDHYMTDQTPNLNNPANLASVFTSWSMSVIQDVERPEVTWTFPDANTINVQLETPLVSGTSVKLWQAINPVGRDFRKDTIGSSFRSTDLTGDANGLFVGKVTPPTANGAYIAYLVQVRIPSTAQPALSIAGIPRPVFVFSTPVRVTPDTYPFPAIP